MFWPAPTPPDLTGEFASNTGLASLQTIRIGREIGPEHIAMGPDGMLYAAMESGNLLRMDPDGGNQEIFANSGGRVLGFDFDASGRMSCRHATARLTKKIYEHFTVPA